MADQPSEWAKEYARHLNLYNLAGSLDTVRDAARKEALDRVQAAYDRLYAERTAEDPEAKDEFTSGLLAGMTELLNAIRADG